MSFIGVIKINFVSYFSGGVVLNYTTTFEPGSFCVGMIADQTTPDAVLLAHSLTISRMYPNGTADIIVGGKNKPGYVWVYTVKESATCLKKFK